MYCWFSINLVCFQCTHTHTHAHTTPSTMIMAISLVPAEQIPLRAVQEYSPASVPSRGQTLQYRYTSSCVHWQFWWSDENNHVMLGVGLASNPQERFSGVFLCCIRETGDRVTAGESGGTQREEKGGGGGGGGGLTVILDWGGGGLIEEEGEEDWQWYWTL